MKFYYLLFLVVLSVCFQSGSSCTDKYSRCPGWKEFCTSSKWMKWMKKYCQKTCNHCPDTAGSETCLTSSNYPSNYEDDADTIKQLTVPAGKGIQVTFKDFDVEAGDVACEYDYVEFLDGNGQRVGQQLCGSKLPEKFKIATSTATVKFHSDGSVTKKGYHFCYTPVSLATDNKPCLCGLANRKNTRIVGGTETNINEYPWLVAILFRSQNFKGGKSARSQCGGTLINDRWILSAAHCVTGETTDSIKIALGEHDWSTESETTSFIRNVIKIESHNRYSEQTMDYDFALLKIDTPVDFSKYEHIRPACLPQITNIGSEPDTGMVGDWATAAGWGNTQFKGENSDVVLQVNVKVVSNSQCNDDYKDAGDNGEAWPMTDRMFCAGVPKGGKDTCQNDSGGPLMYAKGDGVTAGQNYEVKGVVSFGKACALAGKPGVYAKVSYVLPWIKAIVADGNWCPRT